MSSKTLLARDPSLLTEAQWASLVNEIAQLGGWRKYHTYLSKRSPKGFPDLVLLKPPRLLFIELKTEAKTSKTTPEQNEWLADLGELQGPTKGLVQAYVFRPSDYPEVVELLTGRPLASEQKWSDYHERRDKAYRKRQGAA